MIPILLVVHNGGMQIYYSYADASEVYGTLVNERWYLLEPKTSRYLVGRMAAARKVNQNQQNKILLQQKKQELDTLIKEIETLEQ